MAVYFNLQSTSATTVYGYNGGVLDYGGYLWILGGSAGIGYGSTRNIIRSSNLGVNWELVTTNSNIGNSNSSSHHATIVYGGYTQGTQSLLDVLLNILKVKGVQLYPLVDLQAPLIEEFILNDDYIQFIIRI